MTTFYSLLFFVCSLLTSLPLYASEGQLIILFGTACAGKTTLAKELKNLDPENVKLIKRTPIAERLRRDHIERVTGKRPQTHQELRSEERLLKNNGQKLPDFKRKALPETIQQIREEIAKGKTVIFDVCLYKPELLSYFDPFLPLYVLVYAPIRDLCKRERERTEKRKRDHIQQVSNRKYILSGFNQLYTLAEESESIDRVLREEVNTFYRIVRPERTDPEFERIFYKLYTEFKFSTEEHVFIKPKPHYDLLIHSGKLSPKEGARKIFDTLGHS